MFCVYHIEGDTETQGLVPVATFFETLTDALAWSNKARSSGFKFVSLVSEVEGNVTKMGVAGLEAHEYEWKKRR